MMGCIGFPVSLSRASGRVSRWPREGVSIQIGLMLVGTVDKWVQFIRYQLYYRRMLKYTPKLNTNFSELTNTREVGCRTTHQPPVEVKYPPRRPPPLTIPAHGTDDLPYHPPLTPKTARTACNAHTSINGSCNRSYNVTPEMNKARPDQLFLTPGKNKPAEGLDSSFQKDYRLSATNMRLPANDRSEKVLNTKGFKDVTNRDKDKNFLRQTVSNATVWKMRSSVSPLTPTKSKLPFQLERKESAYESTSPVPSPMTPTKARTSTNTERKQVSYDSPLTPTKSKTSTNMDRKESAYESASSSSTYFRKKVESEYSPAFPPVPSSYTNYEKEFKPKIYSTKHSRENSVVIQNGMLDELQGSVEMLNFKQKEMQGASGSGSGNYTQRKSQDKLVKSANLRKDKDKRMNETDPVNFFSLSLTMSRKVSNLSVKARESSSVGDLKIQDFKLGSCKGEGRFGKVFPAVHRRSGCLVAIKQIKKEDVRLIMEQFIQQLKINAFIDHPNVVKMYGFFCDKTHFFIMMEYMEQGSLYKHIKQNKKFKEEHASAKLYEICDAVNYLHSHDILHRDIKPENIVLSNGVSKLCDFGWATYSKERRTTYCGTLDYVCPEILEGESYDNFVDIWAIGVLAYQMLTGKAPFYHISRKETMKSIMNCDFSLPLELSMNAKLFIKKALQKKPDERFTIQSLLNDRFLAVNRIG